MPLFWSQGHENFARAGRGRQLSTRPNSRGRWALQLQAERSLYRMKNIVALLMIAAPSLLYGMFEFGVPFQPPLALYREAMPLLLFSLLCAFLGFVYLARAFWVSLGNR